MDGVLPLCSHGLDTILQEANTLPAVLNDHHSNPDQADNQRIEQNQAAYEGSAHEQIGETEVIGLQHESVESFPVPRTSQRIYKALATAIIL